MSDEKWKFRAEDFESCGSDGHARYIAGVANAKLAEWIEAAPRVSGVFNGNKPGEMEVHNIQYAWATHRARIICIEPIKQDTFEELWRLVVSCAGHDDAHVPSQIVDRARKLLDKK